MVVAGRAKRRGEQHFGRPVKVAALATHVPPRVMNNTDFEKLVDTTDEWIRQRTGVVERHVVEPGVGTSALAVPAAKQAIAQAGLTPDDIDLIVVGTTTPDTIFPSTACLIQHQIGASNAWGFDLGAACSGFTYALTTAAELVSTGSHRHALAIGADVMSSILDYEDRATCVLFGDGADGSGAPALRMPAGGSLRPASHETVNQRLHFVQQDGQAVFKFAVRKTEECCRRILAQNEIGVDRLDLFVSHQANKRIIMSAAARLGLDEKKVVINIDRYGNTTGATIPLALSDALADGRLKKGDLVLLVSVGAGFTVGSVLLRWAF